MITFPNAKINLGLRVFLQRADGFHDIETLMVPVSLRDMLEFSEASATALFTDGLSVPAKKEENLVMKAYRLLQAQYDLPPLHIYLYKNIPPGAGLGGGSADAAFMLSALNRHFALGMDRGQLEAYAAALSSDSAFFINNKPALATGRGNELQPIELDLKDNRLVLVYPGFEVSTAKAYAGVIPRSKKIVSLRHQIKKPLSLWKDTVENDFEAPIFEEYPEIKTIKEILYEEGAAYASMSGSGAAVFGIFRKEPELSRRFPGHYSVWHIAIETHSEQAL